MSLAKVKAENDYGDDGIIYGELLAPVETFRKFKKLWSYSREKTF